LAVPGWTLFAYLFLPRDPELTGLGMVSPVYAVAQLVEVLEHPWRLDSVVVGAAITAVVHVGLAAYFFALALIDFNRKVGRVSLPAAKAVRQDLLMADELPVGVAAG
jgi:hypothetical protein